MAFELQQFYSQREVAGHLGVSTKTIGRLMGAGKLPAARVGGQLRILGTDVIAYLESRGTARSSYSDSLPQLTEKAAAVDLQESYSLAEAAEILKINLKQVYRMKDKGILPVEGTGKSGRGSEPFKVKGADLAYLLDVKNHLGRIIDGEINLESTLFCQDAVTKGRLQLEVLRNAVYSGASGMARKLEEVVQQYKREEPLILSWFGAYPVTIPTNELKVSR